MNFSLTKSSKQILGVDIGSRYVKALLLSQKGKRYCIDAIACEPVYGNAMQEREIKDYDAVNHALKKVKKSLGTSVKNIAIAISGSTVLTKVVDMDQGLTDVELEAQIEIEADSLIPYPLNEVYIDFEDIGPCQRKPGRSDVLLSVAHKNIVENRTLISREVDFEVKIMDIEGYALGNAMLNFADFSPDDAVFCLNVGAAQLQLTVIKNGQVIMSRELPFGTDMLVNEIAASFNLSQNDAQKGLVSGDLPDTWKELLYPQFLSTLQIQINRIMQLYATTFNAEMPDKIYMCGGATIIDGVISDLAMDMQIDIEAFNPLASFEPGKGVEMDDIHGAQFVVAAGLAWRGFSSCHT